MPLPRLPLLALVCCLAACGGASTTPATSGPTGGGGSGGGGGGGTSQPPLPQPVAAIGDASRVGAGYRITQTGVTTDLPASSLRIGGQTAWSSGGRRAVSYAGTEVLALAGLEGSDIYGGISGTQTAAPTGNATLVGRYSVAATDVYLSEELRMTFDAATGALTNSGGELEIDAQATGPSLDGSVTFRGRTADLEGGFYGTKEAAAVFIGTNLAGVFWGK